MADVEHALTWRAPAALQEWVDGGSHWLARTGRLLHIPSRSKFEPKGLGFEVDPLSPGSAEQGQALLRGEFHFAQHRLRDAPCRIFQQQPPSAAWHEQLLSLRWLRHLAATRQELARLTARSLLEHWCEQVLTTLPRHLAPRALVELSLAARFMAERAPHEFQLLLSHTIATLAKRMTRRWPATPEKALSKAIALTYATTAFRMVPAAREQAHTLLASTLPKVILPDGGHVSRNGARLVDVALDLLPLRRALQENHCAVPPALNAAIERIVPMLRLLCMGDGDLACLQGAAPKAKELAAVLAADASQGRPLSIAPHAGFGRLAFGKGVLVMDTGQPLATQGTLAFEFSHGAERIIVSCGTAGDAKPDWRTAMQSSAAFSTWDTVSGPAATEPRVAAELISSPQGALLRAQHETTRQHHHITHQRNIFLAASGMDLRGEERVDAPHGPGSETLRFHLHPAVEAEAAPHPNCVALTLASGARWTFSQAGGTMALEDSVHMKESGEPQPCRQIVLRGAQANGLHIQWALRKSAARP